MKGEETDDFVKVSVSLRREIKPGIFLGQRLMFSSPPPGSSGLPLRVAACVGSVQYLQGTPNPCAAFLQPQLRALASELM